MIAALLPLVGTVLNKILPDKAAREAATLKLMELEQEGELKELDAAMQVVVAEAKSEHSLTSQWRPITMLTFVAIIANNYLLYPYLSLFWTDAPVLPLPEDLYSLLKIGLGGYVVGRSGEKIAKELKK
jgi:hypothetical protein